MSVAIDPSATIRIGDTLLIRFDDRYYRQVIDSMQVERVAVSRAHEGQHVGIRTSLHRRDVPLGSVVYLERKEDPSIQESDATKPRE